VQPFNFLAGTETLDTTRAGWVLDQPRGDNDRTFRTWVPFSLRFGALPLVHIGIVGFDIGNQDSARLTATVSHITPEGFEVVLSTWLATRMWRVDISWLAIGAQ
jgi:H-type lectin domain